MLDQPVENKQSEFTPYTVHVRNIEFSGNPPALSAFPEWVWYTIAPACLWGGLGDEILSKLQEDLELEYYQKAFDTPIFSGFEGAIDDLWNRTLWAVAQVDWSKFKTALLEVTNIDVTKGLMIKYGLQELTIYDPLAIQTSNVITPQTPTAVIYAFGVMSNQGTIAFNPAQKLVERPHVYSQKPEPVIVDLAQKTLARESALGEVAENITKAATYRSGYEEYVDDRLREEGK